MAENHVSTKPALPPSPGWWLAQGASRGFYGQIEYVRPLAKSEFDLLVDACALLRSRGKPKEVHALYKAHEAWQSAISPAHWRLPSSQEHITSTIEDRLVPFLFAWRMAIDQLRHATALRYGKSSEKWDAFEKTISCAYDAYFGYRVVEAMRNLVQHQEHPPVIASRTLHPYTCERCAEEHTNIELSVTIPSRWLLDSEKCPRILKRDLANNADELLDMRALVAEAIEGLRDVLYAMAVSTDEGSRCMTALVEIFREAVHDPGLVQWQQEGRDGFRSLGDLTWMVERAGLSSHKS